MKRAHDRLELLDTFVKIGETGSLSKAARVLETTQPTVSRRLVDLERMLGCRLATRTTTSFMLTHEGRSLLAQHEWIAFSQLASPWSLRFRVGRRDVTVRVRGRLSTSMTSAGRALAVAGAGILGAPDFTLRADVEAGRLVRLFPEARLPTVSLYAAWPGRMEPPAKTRALIDLAKARLRRRFTPAG